MMDFHILTPDGDAHVFTAHRDDDDNGPLQMITPQKLARLEKIEANYLALLELLAAQADAA